METSKLPTWMVLKKAAEELTKKGKTSFTRKELTMFAKKNIDPSRPETSLDFEVDLVTVNSNSKDRYKDPEKLFLFRISRGRYTLYDPDIHGPLEKYLEPHHYLPTRKLVLSQISEILENKGYKVQIILQHRKPLTPDIVADNGKKTAVWVIDPGTDQATQLKNLAYAIGSALLSSNGIYDEIIITGPSFIINKIPEKVKQMLRSLGIKLAILREERRYTLVF